MNEGFAGLERVINDRIYIFGLYLFIRVIFIYLFYLFSHLADAFIQSNLQMRTNIYSLYLQIET